MPVTERDRQRQRERGRGVLFEDTANPNSFGNWFYSHFAVTGCRHAYIFILR